MAYIIHTCPQCKSMNICREYGPEFPDTDTNDEVIIGYLCKNCLHVWTKRYDLYPKEEH